MPVWFNFSQAHLEKGIKDKKEHALNDLDADSLNPELHIRCINNDGLIFSKVNIDLMTDSNQSRSKAISLKVKS
jgi:hypothetical protein